MKIIKRLGLFVLLLIGLAIIGFVIYGYTPARPMPEAQAALDSTAQVEVSTGKWLVFTPKNISPTTGFIFYPGGRVDYRAYAPMAQRLAEQGILVVIVKMPLNLAVFGANLAEDVINAYPGIHSWAIGGHSLGGAMAGDFVYKHPDQINGLVFLAAYPPASDNLSGYKGEVCSISASNDGLATPAKIDASRELLPAGTIWTVIEGGNHAYFGWYGPQSGDNPATISREQQQDQVITGMLNCIK